MDQNKLRTLVFEKTGIRIDTMDPVFALVALNEAVLDESVTQQAAIINAAADRLSAQADRLFEASERYTALLQRLEGLDAPAEEGRPAAAVRGGEVRQNTGVLSAAGAGWQRYAAPAAVALATAILTALVLWMTGFRHPSPATGARSDAAPSVQIAAHAIGDAIDS